MYGNAPPAGQSLSKTVIDVHTTYNTQSQVMSTSTFYEATKILSDIEHLTEFVLSVKSLAATFLIGLSASLVYDGSHSLYVLYGFMART